MAVRRSRRRKPRTWLDAHAAEEDGDMLYRTVEDVVSDPQPYDPPLDDDHIDRLEAVSRVQRGPAVSEALRLQRMEITLDTIAERVESNGEQAAEALERLDALEHERDRIKSALGGAKWVGIGLFGGMVLFVKELLELIGLLRGGNGSQ